MRPLTVLLDTNVLFKLILRDHDDHSPRAARFLEQISAGEVSAIISDTMIFEAVYLLEKTYKVEREKIVDTFELLLGTAGIEYLGSVNLSDAFSIYAEHRQLSIADSYHASLARSLESQTIVSFDRGYDRVTGVTRIEPPLTSNDQ